MDAKKVPNLIHEIENLREELTEKEVQLKKNEADRAILGELYDKGVIDEHGNVLK